MADVYPVVAGTDGSVRAGAAVTEAAAEAVRQDLRSGSSTDLPRFYGYAGLDPTPPPDILQSCQDVLDSEQTRIEKDFPRLQIHNRSDRRRPLGSTGQGIGGGNGCIRWERVVSAPCAGFCLARIVQGCRAREVPSRSCSW